MRIWTAVIDAANIPKHIICQYEYKDCAIFNKAVKDLKQNFCALVLHLEWFICDIFQKMLKTPSKALLVS